MRKAYGISAALVVAFALVAWASPDAIERYEGLQAVPAEIIVNDTGDTLTIGTTPDAGRYIAVNGNPNAYARVDFSGAAADTVIVYCNLWMKLGRTTWTYLGTYQLTVTAGAVVDANGDNVGTDIAIFDTSAATYVEFRIAAPSAGNADVTAWVGAVNSAGR